MTEIQHDRAPRSREDRSRRRRLGTTLLCTLLCGAAQQACGPPSAGQRQESQSTVAVVPEALYEGAWFTVAPPPGFTARPSLTSETAEGYDSVFFDSPDRRAVFYVCSPQWGRDATDVAPDPATETVLADETTEVGEAVVERLWIAALDGSYTRLVEIVFSPASGAQWVFGFQYHDELARDEYLDRYERFKASLEQYAD